MKSRKLICIGILVYFIGLGYYSNVHALTDADGDLLPDEWEALYFESSTSANSGDDADADKLTNLDERFAGTNPTVSNSANALTESELLHLFQGKSFLYFWEQSEPPYFFTHDNANYNGGGSSQNFNSNAAVGFSFVAYVIADENDWVKHDEAYARIKTALARLVELQAPAFGSRCVALNQQGNRHGYTYHFVDNNGLRSFNNVEISTIDHALLTAGALVAASYYRGTEVEVLATQLFQNTEWNWLFNPGNNFFYQGWLENCPSGGNYDGGTTLDSWNRYSELMILLFQAMSASPSTGVGSIAWQAQARGTSVMFPNEWADIVPGDSPQNFAFLPNMPNVSQVPDLLDYKNTSSRFRYIHAGSIHNHQYAHMYADFRRRPDGYRQTDFFANSINATLANREYCIQLNAHAFGGDSGDPDPYETYGPNAWGLLAGITSDGLYRVMQPIIMPWDNFSAVNIAANNDSGTVFLWAPVGSTSFTPRESIDFMRNIFTRYQNNETGYNALVGRYGFMNSFNLGRGFYRSDPPGHFSSAAIGIDIGQAAGGIENYLTGLVWKHAMRRPEISVGMGYGGAGFNTGAVEPFILNFDDNPPLPHEDPNGGGIDPNSFGGSMYSFGSGTIGYIPIGDPRPDIPFGPQNWVAELNALSDLDTGGFILLNNHSESIWDRLSFWIKAESASARIDVGLKDSVIDYKGSSLQAIEVKLPITDFIPSGQMPTDWTEVRIPLSAFSSRGVRLTRLDNISFTNRTAGGSRIWIDDIAFLGDEFAPASPQHVQANVEGSDVRVRWDENQEVDVVGYNVYRKRPSEMNFVKLNGSLIVASEYVDPGAASETFEYAVTAVDNGNLQNESVFSDPFFWSVHHSVPFVRKETYSSAATAKMILNYLHADQTLTQDQIYSYGHPLNQSQNQSAGTELDPKGIDAALGHFDPYDALLNSPYNSYDSRPDGNPYQGYNFTIVSRPSTQMNEYMRDLAHWMDYPVPLYTGSGQRTDPEKVPPAAPIFGTYANWLVVNGFSASADPLPDENNPFLTPNFFIYGFWLTDPSTSGIGINRFITAEEAQATYFRPVASADIYNTKFVMVAEPPLVRSTAKVQIARATELDANKDLVEIASSQVLSTATQNVLQASSATANINVGISDSQAISSTEVQLFSSIPWTEIIPPPVLSDPSFARAFSGTRAVGNYKVTRTDGLGSYFIIPFAKRFIAETGREAYATTSTCSLVSVAIIVDAAKGIFREATWAERPTCYQLISKDVAVSIVLNYIRKQNVYVEASRMQSKTYVPGGLISSGTAAELVWWPGNPISSSPFNPIWKVTVNGRTYYVDQDGTVKPS